MTSGQFFIILGTIYLVPDTEPRYRKVIGIFLIAMAVTLEFVR
jgi:hypothetical protein